MRQQILPVLQVIVYYNVLYCPIIERVTFPVVGLVHSR